MQKVYLYISNSSCGGIVKPNVVFFGQNLDPHVREKAQEMVEQADSLLVVGSSLKVFSAFRLVRQAVQQGKRVIVLSLGPTRADDLAGVEKIDQSAEEVLPKLLEMR
jgi:NAD-dependent deacetylase sirtuin 4